MSKKEMGAFEFFHHALAHDFRGSYRDHRKRTPIQDRVYSKRNHQ
jgi:hypothetical protein